MRQEKIVEIDIDDKTKLKIKIFEIRPIDILDSWQETDENESVPDLLKRILPFCCDTDYSELIRLYPNDQTRLWEAFKELNAPLFGLIDSPMLAGIVNNVKNSMRTEFERGFASSLETAIETPKNTD
jgi:methyl coenzyme M reductase subunit D